MRLNLTVSCFCLALISGAWAQTTSITTEQCLSCHGPFEKLIKKDIRVPADPFPINPHTFVPHDGKGKYYDCIACHQQHTMPPPKGYKDTSAHIEPCFSCHHGEQIQNCKNCHKN